ncbi:MAG: ABC transporter permease [Candidatus Bathycorpusculaceae bacterium]
MLQQLNRIPVDITISSSSPISSDDWNRTAASIGQIDGIVGVEIISRATLRNEADQNYTTIIVTAISNTSKVYDGLNVTEGAPVLGVNETYVWIGSKAANKIALNSTLILNFTYHSYSGKQAPEVKTFYVLPLKVVGFADLDDKAYSIATGGQGTVVIFLQYAQAPSTFYEDLLLIVDWEKTFTKVLDRIPENAISYGLPISTQILVYLDRDSLINPWDIPSSMEAVERITSQITNMVGSKGMYVSNNIRMILMTYYATSIIMRFAFIIVTLPVFFVAWYVGTTVSDVSYNLRRREIGLLLTKGFSNSQLFRLFLTESILIGIIGGLAGVGLGFLLGPIFTTASWSEVSPVLSTEVIIITVIFGLAVTLLSTFRPSRRAAKLPPVEALREYTYIEEVKPYKQRGPWIAFILGLYKIVTFLLGINLAQMFAGNPPPFTNIFLIILLGIWIIIDTVLIYIGPLLFFWGFTKIFIRGSLKFQELVARTAKFLGDLGTLATKSVQRNPARAASIAFLVALIVGYSFQTIGDVARQQDYTIRQIKAEIGADISISPSSTINITRMMENIGNLAGVASTTLQYSISGSVPGDPYSRQIIAVDPDTWLSTAYYEEEWFSGNNVATAFQLMKAKNQTIILERSVASHFNREIGDTITITIGSSTLGLEIVGFFGPEITQEYGRFWSYIPMELYESLSLGWQPSATILAKLKPNADGKAVAADIRKLEGVNYVRSVAEELENLESNLLLIGPLNIQRLGVIFAILAASVAVGLATLVSLQERKREASIMSARGLSFRQLTTMLLTENMAIVTFSVILGVVVGLIVVHGNVAASNAAITGYAYSLVTYRMVFPPEAIMLLASCLILIFASTIIPTVILTKRYISKTERIVRL